MAIIIVSHQMGAGGPEIGRALAKRLGYRYVDQELLLDAARRSGLAEDKLSHLEESKPTLFERFDAETRRHITVLQTTLLEFAEADNAVLMRGGRPMAAARDPARAARESHRALRGSRPTLGQARLGDDRGDPQPARRRGFRAARRYGEGREDALSLRGRHQ